MPSVLDIPFVPGRLYEQPLVQKEIESSKPEKAAGEIAEKWIADFNRAIETRNAAAVAELFCEKGAKSF
jgi:hypothetical protein